MKRSGFKNRGKGLDRKTRVKTKRDTPRRSGRVLNEAYLAIVRTLPCYACAEPAPSDPDHQGKHPYGRKADDDTAVPLCRECHDQRQTGHIWSGWMGWVFVGGGSVEMREWCDDAIAATRELVLPRLGCAPGVPW